MPRGRRERAYRKGLWAEGAAAVLLAAKGYRILARRYRSPVGEIDLVVRRRRRLAFVEVKVRPTMEDAAWSVTERQRERIVRAAEHWLARHPDDAGRDIAFDVVLMAPWTRPRHVPDAFRV